MSNDKDFVQRRQLDELALINDQLDVLTKQQINKLPESVFVRTFLPFFSGEKPADDKVNIPMWGGIAGNGYFPVDIIDDKSGEVLYQVPPLFDRDAVDPAAAGPQAIPLSHVVTTAEQLARGSSPRRAQNYLDTQLANRKMHNESSDHVINSIRAWNVIFARYNKPLLKMPGEAADAPEQATTAASTSSSAPLQHQDDDLL